MSLSVWNEISNLYFPRNMPYLYIYGVPIFIGTNFYIPLIFKIFLSLFEGISFLNPRVIVVPLRTSKLNPAHPLLLCQWLNANPLPISPAFIHQMFQRFFSKTISV